MSANKAELDRRYRVALDQVRERLGTAVARRWAALPAYDEANISELVAAIETTATAARSAAAGVSSRYLNLLTGTSAVATVNDLPAVDLAADLRPAFMTTWKALADGARFEDAVAAGLARSTSIGAQIVTVAARAAVDVVDQQEPRIVGWERIPEANACNWCLDVSSFTYDTAEAAALGNQHDNCKCDVVPAVF